MEFQLLDKISIQTPKTTDFFEGSLPKSLITDGYLAKLFLWFGLLTACFLTFIWVIDPYGVSPIKIDIPSINTVKPKRLDIDRLIKPFEVWRYQPKTIFIGTSRIQQSMDPSVFDGTSYAPAYNAAIPASSLAENEAHIAQYLKLDANLKHIFMELFLYNFVQGQTQEPEKSWSQFMNNNASLQISSDAFLDAMRTISSNRQHGPIPAHIAKLGYRVPSSDFDPASTFSPMLNIHYVLTQNRAAKMAFQPSALESLQRIVKLAHDHDVQIHFFLTPNYPWDDYRLLSLGYWPLLEEWLRKIATYSDVSSFSQYNERIEETPTHEPKMTWWSDPIHFTLNMGHAMMLAYLGHPDKDMPVNFMRRVNPTSVESIIKERRIGIEQWAKTHPHYVSDFEDSKTIPDTITGTLNIPEKTLILDGVPHPILLGVGEVVFVEQKKAAIVANGWVVDEIEKNHVRKVVATIGNTVVAQGFATVIRPDIELAIGKKDIPSGFAMEIPLNTWNRSDPIRIFALMKDDRVVQTTSQTSLIDGMPVVSLGKVDDQTLTVSKKVFPIVKRIAGSIEGVIPIAHGYSVSGWAMDAKANSAVTAIIATLGPNIIAKTIPTTNRDDITQLTPGAKPSGFLMNIPFDANLNHDNYQIQLFALMADGIVAPLASNFNAVTHGVFKNLPFDLSPSVQPAANNRQNEKIQSSVSRPTRLAKIQNNQFEINGRTYTIAKQTAGSLENVTPTVDGYSISGWATDAKANAPVIAILAASGANIIAKAFPAINRVDITENVTPGATPAGFNMDIPFDRNSKQKSSQIQLLALMADGTAAPLTSNFNEITHGDFKNQLATLPPAQTPQQ